MNRAALLWIAALALLPAIPAATQMRPILIPSLRPMPAPFVMAVDQVLLTNHDTIVTGRIESGTVHVGDELELVGLGATRRITVEGIDRFRKHVGKAGAGQNVGIHFYRTEPGEVLAGQLLSTRGSMQSCVTFDALVDPLQRGRGGSADFGFRNSRIDGRIIFTGPPRPGDGAVPARVRLFSAFAMTSGQGFAIGRKGHDFGSGIVARCLLGFGINDEAGDDGLVGLVDGLLAVNHGTHTVTDLIAWILAHRMGIDPARIRPGARIVEDLGTNRDAIVRAIEEDMFIDIPDEAAAKIVTVAEATRAARKAMDQSAEISSPKRTATDLGRRENAGFR
jgi:acyl carrier protein